MSVNQLIKRTRAATIRFRGARRQGGGPADEPLASRRAGSVRLSRDQALDVWWRTLETRPPHWTWDTTIANSVVYLNGFSFAHPLPFFTPTSTTRRWSTGSPTRSTPLSAVRRSGWRS